jgi:hypothetical protein
MAITGAKKWLASTPHASLRQAQDKRSRRVLSQPKKIDSLWQIICKKKSVYICVHQTTLIFLAFICVHLWQNPTQVLLQKIPLKKATPIIKLAYQSQTSFTKSMSTSVFIKPY